ncbi:MAG: ABC transporter substrate-binding protein [Bacteroidota bacterium]
MKSVVSLTNRSNKNRIYHASESGGRIYRSVLSDFSGMKTCLIIPVLFVFILVSCNPDKSTSESDEFKKMTLSYNEPDVFRTLHPHSAKDVVSNHIITQIYEGLVKYNPKTLVVEPAIAKKWDIDETGTIYTFYLNDSVFFNDDSCFTDGKGRLVTAEDFRYSFYLLCTKNNENFNFFGTLDKVKGAKEYYLQSDSGSQNLTIEGIQVIDDYQIKITLESENPLFIYFLASQAAVVLPKEGFEKYGYQCSVGSGPYSILSISENKDKITLLKNAKYYKKDSLKNRIPYIDTVQISFIGSMQKELKLFEEGKIDFVSGLSETFVPEFLGKHIKEFESNPPVYILNQSEEETESGIYNLMQSYVQNFYSNRMNFIDLSLVYFKKPEKKELQTQANNN